VNSNPRQIKLLDTVRSRGSIQVDELADMLGVTLQTVRRDVQRLADEGLLARFHGGVRVPSSTTENIGYQQRESLHAAGKARIARAVAAQVPNDCSLNLNVATILSSNPACEVIVAGGSVRSRDRAIVGEATVDFIRQFKVDIALIGVSSIEADGTLRDFDLREVKVAQTVIAQAREVWLAADASKFNRPAMIELAKLSQIDRLFTDAEPPPPFPELIERAQVRCEIAREH